MDAFPADEQEAGKSEMAVDVTVCRVGQEQGRG